MGLIASHALMVDENEMVESCERCMLDIPFNSVYSLLEESRKKGQYTSIMVKSGRQPKSE